VTERERSEVQKTALKKVHERSEGTENRVEKGARAKRGQRKRSERTFFEFTVTTNDRAQRGRHRPSEARCTSEARATTERSEEGQR
jgi:hypothetical protein